MTKSVHVAIYDTLADWEIGHITAHINNGEFQAEPGQYQIVTVGETAEPITTMGGLRVTPDTTLDQVSAADSAMLILPGAATWVPEGNKAFRAKAREFAEAGVPVAAICGATFGMAAEGLLDERAHTSNAPQFLTMSGYKGASNYRDELAVTDGNLITASGIAPVHFAREVFALLGVYEPSVLESWYKLYGQQDPSGYFELMESA